jgi:hypothetical protein
MGTDFKSKNPKGISVRGVYFDGPTKMNNTDFKIKNPKANSVLGMYVDGPIGMGHPLAKIKFQSEVDATLHYQNSTSLKEAIEGTLKRMRFLFGDNIPDELVRTAVSLTYAEHVALKTKKWKKS